MKVFVVENDVGYARCLAIVAEECGCQVFVYHTGRSALQDAPIVAPDVVLLSLSLTDMDGLEFVRQFRQHRALESTSIVAVGGEVENATVAEQFKIDAGLIHPRLEAGIECIMQRLAIAADQQAVIPSCSAAADAA